MSTMILYYLLVCYDLEHASNIYPHPYHILYEPQTAILARGPKAKG